MASDDKLADVIAIGTDPAGPQLYDGLVCPCGSAWFHACAVAIQNDGRVTGYLTPVWCAACGTQAPDPDDPPRTHERVLAAVHDAAQLGCHWRPPEAPYAPHSGSTPHGPTPAGADLTGAGQ